MNKVFKVLDIDIACINEEELNSYIGDIIKNKGKEAVLNVNIHCMNLIHSLPWMKTFFKRSKLIFCDGDGVRILSFFSSNKIPYKITYNRWIWSFLSYCETNNFSVFFLGSTPEIVEVATSKALERFSKLNVVGYHHGFINDKEEIVIEKLNHLKPDVLLLGMGMPLQEAFIQQFSEKINSHVFLTGGAIFSYMSGDVKTTPKIFFNLKLEWLYRLYQEPRRLCKRYLWGIPYFYTIFLKWKFSKK